MRFTRTYILGPVLLNAILLASAAHAQQTQNRQILDIRLQAFPKTFPHEYYRIVIRMDKAVEPLITPPQPGRPLRLEIGGADYAPTLRPSPASNALIRGVSLEPSGSGLVTILFELASPRVDITDYIIRGEELIILKLKPRPGVEIAPEVPSPTLPAAAPGVEQRVAAAPTLARAAATPPPPPALPAAPPAKVASSATLALPLLVSDFSTATATSIPTALLALPAEKPVEGPSFEELAKTDFFPVQSVTSGTLRFRGAEEMFAAYLSKQYDKAIEIGMSAVGKRQPLSSLEALLALLGECKYQKALAFDQDPKPETVPDWTDVLGVFLQARIECEGSALRPFLDYRLSQIYGALGNMAARQATLARLVRDRELPQMPQVLRDYGESLVLMANKSPHSAEDYLPEARRAFDAFLERYPDNLDNDRIRYFLGDVYYQLGKAARMSGGDGEKYDREAFNLIQKAKETLKLTNLEIDAHYALAAHRIGNTDLTRSDSPGYAYFRELAHNSQDPGFMLEYAHMQAQGGNKAEALYAYDRVSENLLMKPEPSQEEVVAARLALARMAYQDVLAGGLNSEILNSSYRNSIAVFDDILARVVDASERQDILYEKALHLLALGREAEALDFILTQLERKTLKPEQSADLGNRVWQILPEAMERFRQQGDPLLAVRVYNAFGDLLREDHPRRNEALLACARVLIEMGLDDKAREAIQKVDSYANLSERQRTGAELLKRELSLNPETDPEQFKREAPDLLGSNNDDSSRARILRRLAGIYSKEGQHAYAAQLYLQGCVYDTLPWQRVAAFYTDAATEYEQALIYSKAFTTHWQGIRAIEKAGVAPAQAGEWMGNFLMGMGENAQKMGDHAQAALAYEQYLKNFPQGPKAESALYFLAQAYEAENRRKDAIAKYDELAKVAQAGSFWSDVAQKSASQLRWEDENAEKKEPQP